MKEEYRFPGRHRTRVIYLDHVENIREGFSEDRTSEKKAKGQIGIFKEKTKCKIGRERIKKNGWLERWGI